MEENKKQSWTVWYRIALAVITVICVCIGTLRYFVNFFSVFSEDEDSSFFGEGAVSNILEVDEFTDIDLDVSIAEVRFEEGEHYQVEYRFPKKLVPKIEVKNEVLTIRQKTSSSFFGLKNTPKHIDCELVITLPGKAEIDHVSLDIDLGTADIRALNAYSAEIDADMGDINITDCCFEKLSINADMGNIEIRQTEINSCELDADMGSIEGRGLTGKSITCDADMGSVDLEGDFDRITASCSMGSVDIKTKRDEEEVHLDLKADMGSVTFNGRSVGRKFHN